MNFFQIISQAAQETTAEATTVAVQSTGYGDTLIPNSTLVCLWAGMILIVGVAVLLFALVKPRIERFGQTMLYGAVSFMFFYIFVGSGILMALNTIPAVNQFFSENTQVLGVLQIIFTLLGSFLAVFVGMILVKRSQRYREGVPISLGEIMMFALGAYIAFVLLSQPLVKDYNYIAVASTINQYGFDYTVSLMVQGGMGLDESVAQLYSFATEPSYVYLLENLVYVFQGLLLLGTSIMVYGAVKKRMNAGFYGVAVGFFLLYYLPYLINLFTDIAPMVRGIICFVISAVCFVVALWAAKKYLPEEWEYLSKTKKQREQPGSKKMPKINMPK